MTKIHNWILLVLGVVFFSSCMSIPIETVYIPNSPSGWKVGHANDVPGKGSITEFVRESENIQNWTQLVTIQFLEKHYIDARVFMAGLQQTMRNRCPDVDWKVLEETVTDVLYEWSVSDCSEAQTQHEIARLLEGNEGLHRVAYTEKSSEIDSAVRMQWIDLLKSAYVEKDEQRVVVNEVQP